MERRALFVETEAQNVTVAPGDRAVLTCRVQQLGAKTVRRTFFNTHFPTPNKSLRYPTDTPY